MLTIPLLKVAMTKIPRHKIEINIKVYLMIVNFRSRDWSLFHIAVIVMIKISNVFLRKIACVENFVKTSSTALIKYVVT